MKNKKYYYGGIILLLLIGMTFSTFHNLSGKYISTFSLLAILYVIVFNYYRKLSISFRINKSIMLILLLVIASLINIYLFFKVFHLDIINL